MRLKITNLLFIAAFFIQKKSFADEKDDLEKKHSSSNTIEEQSISVDFHAEEKVDDGFFAVPIEQLLRNSAFVSGLNSGADAINSSVESLMDAVFYGILDSDFEKKIDNNWTLVSGMRRDLFSAPDGSYIVIDRIKIGPSFGRELWRAHDISVALGVDGAFEVFDIYRRYDGMRVFEKDYLPQWRIWANNWLGLLPILTAILPPSFNQNELYDPLRLISGPLTVPLTSKLFFSMPVGSIRSYAISGGINVPVNFSSVVPQTIQKTLRSSWDLNEHLPYSIFVHGEHRINVLRRDNDTAWVGLKKNERFGHNFTPLVGNQISILKGALAVHLGKLDWIWSGVPIAVFPLDWEFEQSLAHVYDQVYEFDMRNVLARESYEAAVRGDFTMAGRLHEERVNVGKDTGVKFHFTRRQSKNEAAIRNRSNLALLRKDHIRDRSMAEVEVTDVEGKFFVLESQHDLSDKSWDVLVGEEDVRYQSHLQIPVQKIFPNENTNNLNDFSYLFDSHADPLSLSISMAVNDRFADVSEYREYLKKIQFFTKINLKDVPEFDLVDAKRLAEFRQKRLFDEPENDIFRVHVMPQHIGGFGAYSVVHFSKNQIEKLVNLSEDSIWRAFARAFGENERDWWDSEKRDRFVNQLGWLKYFFMIPARIFQVKSASADFIAETTNAIRQLKQVKESQSPTDQLDAFYRLFDSDYIPEITRALLELADLDAVPRNVRFSVQPKGLADQRLKDLYRTLNNKVFHEGPVLPVSTRYQVAQEKIAEFYLDRPRDGSNKPSISRVFLTSQQIPLSLRSLPYSETAAPLKHDKHAIIMLECKNTRNNSPLKVFVRVEQAGKLKLGKLHLAEQVFDILPLDEQSRGIPDLLRYEFYLTGPLSPVSSFLFEEAVEAGDSLSVTIAVSADGVVWSSERQLEFRLVNGRLSKPE